MSRRKLAASGRNGSARLARESRIASCEFAIDRFQAPNLFQPWIRCGERGNESSKQKREVGRRVFVRFLEQTFNSRQIVGARGQSA